MAKGKVATCETDLTAIFTCDLVIIGGCEQVMNGRITIATCSTSYILTDVHSQTSSGNGNFPIEMIITLRRMRYQNYERP